MKTTVGCWTLALALSVVSATASGEAVLESEREIPVAAEVDVLVVGGTAAADYRAACQFIYFGKAGK